MMSIGATKSMSPQQPKQPITKQNPQQIITPAQKVLESIQKQKISTSGVKLSVKYDTQQGKYIKHIDDNQVMIDDERAIFTSQIGSTDYDIDLGRSQYIEAIAANMLDELQTELQREQIIDDIYSQNLKQELGSQFDNERKDFLDCIKAMRADFDKFDNTKQQQKQILIAGSQVRDIQNKVDNEQKSKQFVKVQQSLVVSHESLKKK